MRFFLKILFAPFIWFLQACSPIGDAVDKEISNNHYFNKSKTDVLFSRGGNWFELGQSPMQVDLASFKVFNPTTAKDKGRAYYLDKPIDIPYLDLASFRADTSGYMWQVGFDKKHVYLLSADGDHQIVEGADPETFSYFAHYWAKDKSQFYFEGAPVEVDYASFKLINKSFAIDEIQAYYFGYYGLEGFDANVEHFKCIDDVYCYDDRYVYTMALYDSRLEGSAEPGFMQLQQIPYDDFSTVKKFNDIYLGASGKVYFLGFELQNADFESFRPVGAYGKDKNQVYYGADIIEDADAESFHLNEKTYVYRDKHGEFRFGKRID